MKGRGRAGRRPAALTAVVTLLALSGLAGAPAAAAACPNEALRAEQGSLALGDCRAYELVAPQVVLNDLPARAASDGGAVTYFTKQPPPGATTSSFFFLARRGADGWTHASVGAQSAGGALFEGPCEQNVFFAPDLRRNILESGWFDSEESARCKRPLPIVPGEPDPYRNVFLEAGGGPRLVNLTPAGVVPANATFQDAADDLSRIVFAEAAKLTPDAPDDYAFYVWSGGVVRPLTVLPDGTPDVGELVEATHRLGTPRSGFAPATGALSADGSRAFFYSGDGLYLRQNPDQPQSTVVGGVCTEPARACTVQVDASQGPDPSGGGVFWRASEDGAAVFFTATNRLTPDSTAVPEKADLYRYDVASGALSDLTVSAGEAGDVRGVSGIAADGSRIYFVANGALAPGATPGDCPAADHAGGHCNLYVLAGGTISFIARLASEDWLTWQESPAAEPLVKPATLTANVSAGGRFLAFLSIASLTGYDNLSGSAPERATELFVYDADAAGSSGALACASCPPGPDRTPEQELASIGNYGPDPTAASWKANSVLDDGSVFFNSADALLAADINGEEDAYRWRGGGLELISVGSFPAPARFLDASPDGADVFFRTAQRLVARDTDESNFNIYDARVGGGFAEPLPPAPPCVAAVCRAPAAPISPQLLPTLAGPQPQPKPCRRAKKQRRRHCRGGASKRGGKERHQRGHRRGKGRR